jgi:hypothetical protein
MSKILEQNTQFNDLDCLREAATEQGFETVYDDGNLVTMHGYNSKTFQVNLGITKGNFESVTGMSTYGDLGFRQQDDGNFKLIGDDILIKSREFGGVMDKLTVSYSEKKYCKEMFQQGYALATRTQDANGGVDLQFMEIGMGY